MIAVIAGGLAAAPALRAPTSSRCARWARREVSPQEAPELHAMIERLCVQADLPKPKVAVADTSMPNAFALGRSPKNATVCATTGIMELLSPAELEGVMAHELTPHRQPRRDGDDARRLLRHDRRLHRPVRLLLRRRRPTTTTTPASSSLFLVSLAVYVISFFLMQALSRYREFAADRGAAIITGRPSALASALMKISSGMAADPAARPARRRRAARLLHLPARRGQGHRRLFSTHPPMEKRIAALAAPRGAAAGHRVGFTASWASSTSSRGRRALKQPAPDRLFAMSTAYVKLEMASSSSRLRQGRRSSSSRSRPPTSTASCSDMEEVAARHRRGDRHDGRDHRRRRSATAG